MDAVELFRAATAHAADVVDEVGADALGRPTPCAEWTVQDLVDHMVGSTEYVLAACAGRPPTLRVGTTPDDYRSGVRAALDALAEPGVLEHTCTSPLGFEWTVRDAAAGAFMDTLVHTWDLAVALGRDPTLASELVDACITMFLPEMPERGRASGLVGPAVDVGAGATPQDRLLGAMGRRS